MKILLAKPGLDGHDVGVKVLAHALIDAGFQVVYTGLRKSIEQIIERAKMEEVDVIGLSILSGTHVPLCERMKELMDENKLDIPWIVGGNIPANDVAILEKIGATKAFATGTSINAVVDYVGTLVVIHKA
jgi:methylmalonyl-CoA mutase C-terminal domain/subunit